jgi:Domain of unknown function (DUF6306)
VSEVHQKFGKKEIVPMTGHDDEPRKYASSPCFADEFEVQRMPLEELLSQLNVLVESERAGTRGLLAMAHRSEGTPIESVLHDIARDEARFCSMLSHHVARLGGTPSHETGEFLEKLLKRPTLEAQLSLVDRGQRAVVGMIDAIIPRIDDPLLRQDLMKMRDEHIVNLARAASVTE